MTTNVVTLCCQGIQCLMNDSRCNISSTKGGVLVANNGHGPTNPVGGTNYHWKKVTRPPTLLNPQEKKERFEEVFTRVQPMNTDLDDHFGNGDEMKFLENARIMALSLIRTEIWRTFKRILCDVTLCQKATNTRVAETRNLSLFRVLSALQAGELIDSERY
ncbi:hypothetical protein AVEN_222499-1 [Araneus ventricosus]|uniref:Uncharacterized protein n=1 Tax=Araneus ventricosus TaxID=182803 RepID=A0A4Y2N4T4_ARAVE|nr:hypothetical protein AVEN_222499-1 [Araneus ventricosus]